MRLTPEQAPWLHASPAVAVLDALEAAGGEGRFVGGCVRNAILGAPVDDLDVATPLTPPEVIAALERAGIRAVPTGVEHGTVTAVVDHRPVEVTTLRRDVETDGRRAVVVFTADWAEDAARRDFRLNALYADRDGRVFDHTGEGVADALGGRVVFVGEPETRIREDYLRILRYFRFGAWYGRDWPSAADLDACAGLGEGLRTLSAERIGKELLKLLAAPDPTRAVALMAQTGVLSTLLPELGQVDRFGDAAHLTSDPELRLSVLIRPDAEAVRRTAQALRLSNAQRDRLLAAVEPEPPVHLDLSKAAALAALYRTGPAAFRDRLIRAWVEAPERRSEAKALLRLTDGWERPRFPLNGDDLAEAGVSRGPALGRALRMLEQTWVDGGFQDDRAALLARLGDQFAGP
jgi:poly(A) polymerase